MFTTERLIFTGIFVFVFIIALVIAYRGDIRKNRDYFKGTYKVFILIALIFTIFYTTVKLLS